MIDNYITVGQQVFILFMLMSVGFISGKTKILGQEAVAGITDLVLYIVTPCVIIISFQRKFDKQMLSDLGLALLIAILVHAGSILLTNVLIHDKEKSREKVLRFSSIFSNCAYMSLPLQQALLGDEGVFYGAAYIAVFNIVIWSYGLFLMSGDRKSISPIRLLINPGVLSVIIGFIFYLSGIVLHKIIAEPVGYMASLNTPLPMIIIGFYLSNAKFNGIFNNVNCYISIAARLLIAPFLTLFILSLCEIGGVVMVSCVIAACAPTAATTTMFATKFNRDAELSVGIVSLTTLLSIFTIPIVVGVAQYFA